MRNFSGSLQDRYSIHMNIWHHSATMSQLTTEFFMLNEPYSSNWCLPFTSTSLSFSLLAKLSLFVASLSWFVDCYKQEKCHYTYKKAAQHNMEYSQLRNSSGGMNKIVWWHIAGVEVGGGEIYMLQSWGKKSVCVCVQLHPTAGWKGESVSRSLPTNISYALHNLIDYLGICRYLAALIWLESDFHLCVCVCVLFFEVPLLKKKWYGIICIYICSHSGINRLNIWCY